MSKTSEKERKRTEKEIDKTLNKAKHAIDNEDYSGAVFFYQEASRLAAQIRDRRAVDFSMDAARYSMKTGSNFKIGWSYKCAASRSLLFRDFSNALSFAEKAIEYFSRSNSMYAVQWCYNIAGRASENMGDHELALKKYRKSLEIGKSEDIEGKVREIENKIKNKEKSKKK
jgi:tetratricopeptide (TPR) repeat protein